MNLRRARRNLVSSAIALVAVAGVISPTDLLSQSVCDVSRSSSAEGTKIKTLLEQLRVAFRLNAPVSPPNSITKSISTQQQYVTRLAANDLSVLRHTVVPARLGDVRSFRTLSPDDIDTKGYVRRDGRNALYVAPNEQVLLSDTFASGHCFGLTMGVGADSALIGLSFAPSPARRLPEIAGTLWADVATGTPRYVEFWFIDDKIPMVARGRGKTGGELFFGQLPDKTWVAIGWRLRTPRYVSYVNNTPAELVLMEVGGRSTPILSDESPIGRSVLNQAYQRFIERFSFGGVDAELVDLATGAPLANARVTLRQQGDALSTFFQSRDDGISVRGGPSELMDTVVVSDSSGRIHVVGLPSGMYELRFAHDLAHIAGVEPAAIDVEVLPGVVTRTRAQTASTSQTFSRCGREIGGAGLYGYVFEGEGHSLPYAFPSQASVVARWQTDNGKKEERKASSDMLGRYTLCGLPPDVQITLETTIITNPAANYFGMRVDSQRNRPPVRQTVVLGVWRLAYLSIAVPLATNAN